MEYVPDRTRPHMGRGASAEQAHLVLAVEQIVHLALDGTEGLLEALESQRVHVQVGDVLEELEHADVGHDDGGDLVGTCREAVIRLAVRG